MSIGSFGHFVEISQSNLHLSLYRGFLEIHKKQERIARIPLDDILGLVVTGYGCSHSSNILVALAERNIPVSICGFNFSPKALILPVDGNCRQNLRIRGQSEMTKPLRKRLWKQIVQWKLQNQANVLKEFGLPYEGLMRMSKLVQSGDPQNLESQAARRYWISLFSKQFKRDQNGEGINAILNYAYAIVRSCVARGVVATGLHPSIGIHHKNIYNSMCLVDDLMEPFRPIADYVVRQLYSHGFCEVNKEVKHILAKIAVVDVFKDSDRSPLFQVISQLSSSLALMLSKERKQWEFCLRIKWNHFDLDFLKSEEKQFSA